MKILFTSVLTSPKKFREIYEYSTIKPGQQVQKFNGLLARGFAVNSVEITSLASLPVSRLTSKKLFIKGNKEYEDGIYYNHIGFINIPVIKQLCILTIGFFKCMFWMLGKGDKVVICDILAPTLSWLSIITSKIFNIKRIALVTDVPAFMDVSDKEKTQTRSRLRGTYNKVSTSALEKYHAYVLLTKEMDYIANPNIKPFIVVEGMVDSREIDSSNNIDDKINPPVVLYAGALFEKYGLKMLLDGYIKAQSDSQLYIYGSGDMEDDFIKAASQYDNIHYFGVVPNAEVVEIEKKATLLINPRSSHEEFTKYSFPSKNMEYMMSGTAVLTCNLPGMPEEYSDYVCILDNESVEGMAAAIAKLMKTDKNKLHELGISGKKFVQSEKTNITQAKRIIDFIKEII